MTAVEWLVNHWKKLQSEGEKMSWDEIIQITEITLPTERENMDAAFKAGQDSMEEGGKSLDQYFTQKYGHGKD